MGKSSLSHPLPWTFSNLTVATGLQEAENTERKEGEKTRKPGGDSWSLAPVLQPGLLGSLGSLQILESSKRGSRADIGG